MNTLSQQLVDTVSSALKGNRRQKFLDSVKVINDSLSQGGWIKRGSVKAESGFYQGLYNKAADGPLHMCFRFGHTVNGSIEGLDLSAAEKAWITLCNERAQAVKFLNAARPVPVITEIGLSPKVTKTFKECNLDIQLPTIKPAKVLAAQRQRYNDKLEPMFDKDGQPLMETYYYVAWTQGCKLGRSRFFDGCQACGKHIPSGRYVAIEAQCERNGLIGLYVGQDCAKNIFGIVDVGLDKNSSAPKTI